MRFKVVFSTLLLLIGGSTLLAGDGTAETGKPQPNILLIFVDDLNDYLGCLGHPDAKTPNIDRLAAQGVLFTDAHAQAPLCGPSRASMMTGLRPSTTGIYGQIRDEDLREASEATRYVKYLPEYLGEHGYHTMGIGKIFHQHAPEGVFDESGGRNGGFGPKPADGRYFKWNEEGTSTDWGPYPEEDSQMPDYRSASWAIERLNRDYEQPFLLSVGFFRPHVPWYVPQKWFDLYDRESLATPPYRADDLEDIPEIGRRLSAMDNMPTTEWAIKNGEWDNIVEAYLASVSFVDDCVGRVLEALENGPHSDNTIVVLTSDHGYQLGEKGRFAKQCLWDEATRAPLIFKGPGVAEGAQVTAPVELLDIYPTVLGLADLPAYPLNEGKSLRGALEGGALEEGSAAVVTYGRNNHAVISEEYHYIRYEDGSGELYDRREDPHSFTNLAGGDHVDALQSLREHLPERNRLWSPASFIQRPEYLEEQSKAQAAAFDFSVEEAIQYCIWKTREAVQEHPDPVSMPASLPEGGTFWELKPVDKWSWTHGFWPGILWYAAEASGDPKLREEATSFTWALEGMLDREIKSHDIGFIFSCSFGNGLRITGDEEYGRMIVKAADKLMEFYDPEVGTLLSWPAKVKSGEYAPHNTIIDSMMNLELLFMASKISGDPRYRAAAVTHANRVMKDHVRPDFTTCHLVIYDDETGEELKQGTHQGYSDSSTWARGQAWGIYGFATAFRETGDREYLKTAEQLAQVFLEQLPEDHVPYWDFDDPAIPDAPRDASAAAVVASGLIELSSLLEDQEESKQLLSSAREILGSLSTDSYRSFGDNAAFLDNSTGNKVRNREVDVPIIYADYYYLEALLRLRSVKTASP